MSNTAPTATAIERLADFELRVAQSFELRVAQSFENLRVALESRARRDHFGTNRPTSTIIPVPRLAGENALFGIDAIAVAG